MTTNLVMPTNAEISQIAQDFLPEITLADPIFGHMPISSHDTTLVMWEQEDNYFGLQQARGLDGPYPNVQNVGVSQFQARPGVYGDSMFISSTDLTERRQYGTFATPVNIDDLVMPKVRQLKTREVARIKVTLWTLLSSGTFSVLGRNGAIQATDTYPLQTFSASVPWSTSATATPLADLSAVALKWAGHSVSFNRDAIAYMNRTTFNYLRTNGNAVDMYGRRTQGLGTYNSLSQINELFTGDDLPQIVVYDKGYWLTKTSFVRFIPNNKVVVVGRRDDGAAIGGYYMTRNVDNPDMGPGAFMKIIDTAAQNDAPPRRIELYAGHNGMPVITYPSAVVIMTVS